MKRVLFIYNIKDWAIHNVGKLWAEAVAEYFVFDFVSYAELIDGSALKTHSVPYDVIFWGYAMVPSFPSVFAIYRFQRALQTLLKLAGVKTPPELIKKSVTIIHDPIEIFPKLRGLYQAHKTEKDLREFQNWQEARPDFTALKWVHRYCVISSEMQEIFLTYRKAPLVIPTDSDVPIVSESQINRASGLRVMSRASPQRRKNIPLLMQCQQQMCSSVECFDLYVGQALVSRERYLQLLSEHNCYICTSWCEGGPLPIMDALHYGHVILTTPVGQTNELVIHGKNGFFCQTLNEFCEALQELVKNPDTFLAMRYASLELARRRKSNRDDVKQLMCNFLSW